MCTIPHMSTQGNDRARVVRTLLAHQGKSRAELAQVLQVHVSAVNKALSGRRSWSADDIAIMAEFFNVTPLVFFDPPESLIRASGTGRRTGDPTSSTQSEDASENYLSMDQDLVAA